jgi:hypothetical protein
LGTHGDKLAASPGLAEITPRNLRVWLVLIFTALVWYNRTRDYFSGGPGSVKAVRDFADYLAALHAGSQGQWAVNVEASIAVFVLLYVSQLRIFLGVEFSDKSTIFEKSLRTVFGQPSRPLRREADVFIQVIIGIELAVAVFQSYFMSADSAVLVPATLAVQALFIVLFDLRLWQVYQQKNWGLKAIVVNDGFFVLFAIGWLCLAAFSFRPHVEALTFFLITGLMFLHAVFFLFEVGISYFTPMRLSAVGAFKALSVAGRFFLNVKT